MRESINAIYTFDQADPQDQYQLMYEKYNKLFNLISKNENKLYTRKSGPHFFQTNKQTKNLTDTQLMHLGFLKNLFIEDIKTLLQKNPGNAELTKQIESNIEDKSHFINFNRTRYNFFEKEITSSRENLQRELVNTAKTKLKDITGRASESPKDDPELNK